MNNSVQDHVRIEVEELHEFFCGWFTGKLPKSDFEAKFLARFSPDLGFIPPAGRLLGLTDLSSTVFAAHGSNADFRIQIRNVVVQREFNGFILATYEEWQRNALASKPPDNGRIATVLFSAGDPLKWLHIHETWLPEAIMAADAYDF